MKKLILAATLLGISVAYAGGNNYSVTLYRPTTVNGIEFKAGECKVEVHDNKVVVKQGKKTAEADVTVETANQKFSATTVGYDGSSAVNAIGDIRLGGTTTILMFGKPGVKSDASASR